MLLALLLHLCASVHADAQADLFAAVRADSVPGLKNALAGGADINAIGPSGGQTALMAASLGGAVQSVRYLLGRGADPTIGEKDGYTPLHGAAFQGRAEVARLLLQDARVPNVQHADGFYAAHRACWGPEQRHTDTLRAFLEGGDFGKVSASGQTLLAAAQEKQNKRSVALLLDWQSAAEEL
jgi:ankyrin repeat protein